MNKFYSAIAITSILITGLLAGPIAQAQTKVYRTDANASTPPALQAYDVNTDTWATLATLPANNTTQLATDANNLYALPEDGNIYVYNVAGNTWNLLMAGPTAAIGRRNISMFETHNGEFYWGDDATATLHYTVAGVWTSAQTPYSISSAADFDRVTGNLYIRTYSQLGHFSFDTNTGTFAAGCPDTTNVGENSRAGSFYTGNFYTRTWSGNLIATDVSTCNMVDTGVTLTTEHSSTAVDDAGNIYLNGYGASENTLEVQSISGGYVLPLANSPQLASGGGHATLAIIRDGTTGTPTITVPVPAIGQWAIVLMILLLSMVAGQRLFIRKNT